MISVDQITPNPFISSQKKKKEKEKYFAVGQRACACTTMSNSLVLKRIYHDFKGYFFFYLDMVLCLFYGG